ncbi:MAG: RHS repeat-associated core domain-containing protein, partial [Bacteroidota bacterium]
GNPTFTAPTIRRYREYTPFGLDIQQTANSPYNTTGSYRYGFNGKESDENNEFGAATHYDYGFRVYNPAIARFLSVDPLAPDYPWYTPFQFAGNMPVVAIDLDGLEPEITITNTETGYTWIKVYSVDKVRAVIVKTYKAYVHYRNPDGTKELMGEFNVTRDGWYGMGTDASGNAVLVNRSLEPLGGQSEVVSNNSFGYGELYGKDAPAWQLEDVWVEEFPEELNMQYREGVPVGVLTNAVVRDNPGIAKGAQIHVGGAYETTSGKISLGGTYGCFGLICDDQRFSTEAEAEQYRSTAEKIVSGRPASVTSLGNEEARNFDEAVRRRKQEGDSVKITVERRNYDQTRTVPNDGG